MPGGVGPRGLVLAGTHSGCGKTSLTLGLLRALSRRGLSVQPFKAGPDFIDPGLHAAACGPSGPNGRISHNLDTWMMPERALRDLFARHARATEVCVVEGVMGLFDGRGVSSGAAGEEGSTAHLAKLLGLASPSAVVLVVDASSQARSVGALVQGFAHFDPELRLAGVLLNRVGSDSHENVLRRAVAETGVPVLGCLRRDAGAALPSRHLGLVTAQDAQELDATLDALADLVERGVDIPALLERLPHISLPEPEYEPSQVSVAKIGLARDRAFCFLYQENLRLLAAAGAEIVPFSPLCDAALPSGLDGLLLPGGYPELAAAELSANAGMRAAIQNFCRSGRPVWAECGGFMYLLEELVDGEGRNWPMCGAIPGRAAMGVKRAALGYRTARTLVPGPLGPAGTELRGHEFHYSRAEGLPSQGEGSPAWSLEASSGAVATDGWASENVLGGYFHAHLASSPEVAASFVRACAQRRDYGRSGSGSA